MIARCRFALTGPAFSLLMMVACSENASNVNNPGSAGTSSAGTPAAAGASGTAGGAGGSVGAAGTPGTGGTVGAAGSATAGSSAAGAGGANGGSGGGSGAAGASGSAGSGGAVATEPFSFFVTSLAAMRRESGSMDGFGGDLGGLAGADELCRKIAEQSMAGAGAKGWRAFLSTSTVDAIGRIGEGPWYDRAGRVVAMNIDGLLNTRPDGDEAIIDDLPNEDGVPNRAGTGAGDDDNHDTITASNLQGEWDGGSTCDDWTSATGSDGPRVGHTWPAQSGMSWIQAHEAPGCEPSVNLMQGFPNGNDNGIGSNGGYGGIYCFALMP
jgi:hypothetical protein